MFFWIIKVWLMASKEVVGISISSTAIMPELVMEGDAVTQLVPVVTVVINETETEQTKTVIETFTSEINEEMEALDEIETAIEELDNHHR